jgi:hypothetical protein
VIRNVLYYISDICTLVSLTGKLFVACWGYYLCVLWNLTSTSRVSPWFTWDRSFTYPVEVHVCVCVCLCVYVERLWLCPCCLWLFSYVKFTEKSLKNVFIWGDWSLQACKQVFITLMLTIIAREWWFNPPTADCPIHPLAICVLCLPEAV